MRKVHLHNMSFEPKDQGFLDGLLAGADEIVIDSCSFNGVEINRGKAESVTVVDCIHKNCNHWILELPGFTIDIRGHR